ncbi:MAG TPA: sensor histidine kinase [Bryobacteraceae bacterium]|nr:sensor histidine kinase [Bryobacteraceae bacterium]
MKRARTPTFRLLAGLAVTLSAVAVYSAYTVFQLRALERLQTATIDRNRTDSLLLLRIQKDLNDVALTLRDMLDQTEGYPLTAFRAPLARIHADLDDAMEKEAKFSTGSVENRTYLAGRMNEFWTAMDSVFALAESGQTQKAEEMTRVSIQARQESLSTAVSRLLVQNNESEERAADDTRAIYRHAERNVYIFLAAVLVVVVLTSIYLFVYNRRMFDHVEELSHLRSELAQQLITTQENTFRSLSRELHDDFGQILTAIGAMLARTQRRTPTEAGADKQDLREIQQVTQDTLEKVRSLSQSLHPVVLEDAGFEGAIDVYLPVFEKQTGVAVQYEKSGASRELDRAVATHLYRVLQEALNNVVRHSKSPSAQVRLTYTADAVVLEVEDRGVGLGKGGGRGMGLVSMRERAELVNGRVEFLNAEGGGTLIRMTVPAGVV